MLRKICSLFNMNKYICPATLTANKSPGINNSRGKHYFQFPSKHGPSNYYPNNVSDFRLILFPCIYKGFPNNTDITLGTINVLHPKYNPVQVELHSSILTHFCSQTHNNWSTYKQIDTQSWIRFCVLTTLKNSKTGVLVPTKVVASFTLPPKCSGFCPTQHLR